MKFFFRFCYIIIILDFILWIGPFMISEIILHLFGMTSNNIATLILSSAAVSLEMIHLFKSLNKHYNAKEKNYLIPISLTILLISNLITFFTLFDFKSINWSLFGDGLTILLTLPVIIGCILSLIVTLYDTFILSQKRKIGEAIMSDNKTTINTNQPEPENIKTARKQIKSKTLTEKELSELDANLPTLKSNMEIKSNIEKKKNKICPKCRTRNGQEAEFCFICNHKFEDK